MITARRLVISLILAASLVGVGYGLSLSRGTAKAIIYNDPAVKALTPEPGDLALRQARIGVTLAPAFGLAQANSPGFFINGTGIAQDQLDIIPGLNQYFFTPGESKDVKQLPPGRNCVTLLIKRVTDPTDQGHKFSWCFQSH